MEQLWRDSVNSFRRLRSAPIFTAFAVISLALGIGATTAIYSIVYAVVLRPPAIAGAERVANLYHMDPRRGGSVPMISLSFPDFEDYRSAQTNFQWLAPWARFRQTLVAPAGAEVLMGEMVGGEYFSVVGAQAALGRMIQPADERADAPRVIVLSDALWRRQFGGDPNVIGRTVSMGGEPVEVIGVAPAWFRGVDVPNIVPTPAWIPLSARHALNPPRLSDRGYRWLRAIGRLKPGRTMEEALTEFRTIGQGLDRQHPIGAQTTSRSPSETSRRWFLLPAADIRMHESTHAIAGPLSTTVLIAVGLVLLVACTNLANLMVARGTARRHEFAVRLALGASRWRLAREQLIEATIVILAGGLFAFLVARVLMAALLSAPMNAAPGFVVQLEPELNVDVAIAGVLAMGLSLLVFGLVPATQAMRASVQDALRSEGPSASLPRWRVRQGLIALQVSVSAGLVAIAILCAQQLIADARHDSGVDLERLAIARFDFDLQKRNEVAARRLLDLLTEEARRQPGVERVALASGLPIGTDNRNVMVSTTGVLKDGWLQGGFASVIAATPETFDVLGTRIVSGRSFDERDRAGTEPVAVLDEIAAKTLFEGIPAVGRQLHFQRQRRVGEPDSPVVTVTVIGVSSATDVSRVGRRRHGILYVPFSQQYEPAVSVIARTPGDPAPVVDLLRRMINRVDPELAIFEAGTGIVIGRVENPVMKIGAAAATLLGGLALVLAMAGLYGVLWELVQRRTREIGIRIALGAGRSRVVRTVLGDGLRPVVLGLTIGASIGVIARLSFRPMFIRLMPAFDPTVLILVAIPFVAAALLAAYFPARRAARVDPNVALRHL